MELHIVSLKQTTVVKSIS